MQALRNIRPPQRAIAGFEGGGRSILLPREATFEDLADRLPSVVALRRAHLRRSDNRRLIGRLLSRATRGEGP
jgi:hypothetical protein